MKNRLQIKQIALLAVLLGSHLIDTKDFIFDFGGVLILTNKSESFRHIGIFNAAACIFQLSINPFSLDNYIKSRLFTLLDEIIADCSLDFTACELTYDEKGNQLPLLMSAWLQGHITSAEMLVLIEHAIENNQNWFKCAAEKRIIQNTARLIFTPEIFVRSRTISPSCVAFIKKCKRQGHRIYGLSNWDAASFAVLKKQHSELFDLFDGIVISAEVKANKPHPTIYRILLDRYELQAENCWFIDDQQENINAAQKLGINAVRHTSTFAQLTKNIKLAYAQSCSLTGSPFVMQ
jgi:FMN phosphatase YigB (HAD superfamily)